MPVVGYKAFALAALIAAFGISACSITVPVAAVSKDIPGGVMLGSATGSLIGGSVNFANSKISCDGSYDVYDESPTFAIDLRCNDGREGTVVAMGYGPDRRNGKGKFTLNDGTAGEFGYGVEAVIIKQRMVGLEPTSLGPTRTPAAPLPAHGATEVRLEKRGGAYYVPVRINDAVTIPFLLDTGASDLAIPVDVAQTLVRARALENRDFIGKGSYQIANGTEETSPVVRIREVRVGDHTVRNVTAGIIRANGEPLLGQSFLSKFGTVTVDYTRLVLILSPR
jgi:clan AA aspartic protease (TIGR02281 family)